MFRPAVAPLLPWLVRFRWAALFVLTLALPGAQQVLQLPIAWQYALPVLVFAAASNAGLHFAARWLSTPAAQTALPLATGAVLVLDALFLTLLLGAAGGPTNPFTILYFVPVVLSALVLDARWTTWITAWCAVCFASLFLPVFASPGHCHNPADPSAYDQHLRGMWLAFALGGSVVAWIVRKLSLTLSQQRTQIEQLKERALKAGHLSALSTLAAGAAHELRTPLGTIAVAAHELRQTLEKQAQPHAAADAALIESEVERCQDILLAMGPRFVQGGQAQEVDAHALLQNLVHDYAGRGPELEARLCLQPATGPVLVQCDADELSGNLQRLIDNALQATAASSGRVHLSVTTSAQAGARAHVEFSVLDEGAGMPVAVLSRATEPFFTTKAPGQGMGLGLFLVSSFCQNLGGKLELHSEPGRGCRALLTLPAFEPRGGTTWRLQERPA